MTLTKETQQKPIIMSYNLPEISTISMSHINMMNITILIGFSWLSHSSQPHVHRVHRAAHSCRRDHNSLQQILVLGQLVSLDLVAEAGDRVVVVEVGGVDRVLHQAVLLIDTALKGRQGSVHRTQLLEGFWPHFTKAGSWRE